jgi:hypothetical protein
MDGNNPKQLTNGEGEHVAFPAVNFLAAMWCRSYLGVSFNSLLVSGVRGDIVAVLLSVNT